MLSSRSFFPRHRDPLVFYDDSSKGHFCSFFFDVARTRRDTGSVSIKLSRFTCGYLKNTLSSKSEKLFFSTLPGAPCFFTLKGANFVVFSMWRSIQGSV